MGSGMSLPPSEGERGDSARQLAKSSRLEDASESGKGDAIEITSNAAFEERTLEVEDLRRPPNVMLQDQHPQPTEESHLNETQEMQKSQQSIPPDF